jgi:hypothetical protein
MSVWIVQCIGTRAAVNAPPPKVYTTRAVDGFGDVLDTTPKKKLICPGILAVTEPFGHIGWLNVKVMTLPVCTADDRPTVPSPFGTAPEVTTNTSAGYNSTGW